LRTASYDHDEYRRLLWARGIRPVIAERGQEHGSGLGVFRWVVERTIVWLHGFRRLRIRWERRDDIHETFLGLATCLITHRHVQRVCQDLLAMCGGFTGCGGQSAWDAVVSVWEPRTSSPYRSCTQLVW
jgi:transposase